MAFGVYFRKIGGLIKRYQVFEYKSQHDSGIHGFVIMDVGDGSNLYGQAHEYGSRIVGVYKASMILILSST